jgi:hypothetical protein
MQGPNDSMQGNESGVWRLSQLSTIMLKAKNVDPPKTTCKHCTFKAYVWNYLTNKLMS